MIICPSCGNPMRYITGDKNGKKYEFYGCMDWPNCKRSVQVSEAHEYDDGIQPERTIEEEAADLRATLINDGWSYKEADEASQRWIKEKQSSILKLLNMPIISNINCHCELVRPASTK